MAVLRVPLTGAGAWTPVLVGDATASSGATYPANALFDTGANRTAINPEVARALGLTAFGTADVTRVDGEGSTTIVRVPSHLVTIRFDPGSAEALEIATEAIAIAPATPVVDVLIGVDALLRLRIDWDGPGRLATFTR